jgi:myo-inositol-1(or 4)-monophosphatase
MGRSEDLDRIQRALCAAAELVRSGMPERAAVQHKAGGDPVTELDRSLNEMLYRLLPRNGEGWLSEETADDLSRLGRHRVWVVDPIDGTREFLAGIPEWCVSIALIEEGRPVAGGICNPITGETVCGALGIGVFYNGRPVRVSECWTLWGATVLASRTEVARGEWERFRDAPFRIRPVGSVAYKLALVASGRADATFSVFSKNEWDIAAGALLVEAAGGQVTDRWGRPLRFNRQNTIVEGVIAGSALLVYEIQKLIRGAQR